MLRLVSNRLVQIVLLLTLLAGLVFLCLQDPAFIRQARQLTFDAYNRMMPRPPGSGVVIVDIDEASLRDYGQWPWPRTLVAQIPEALKKMGAKAIAFDMVFAEHDRTSPARIARDLPQTAALAPVARKLEALPDNDALFAKKIAETGNVVIGFVTATHGQKTNGRPTLKAAFLDDGVNPDPQKFILSYPYFTTSLPAIVAASAGEGSFTMSPDQDGIVRKVPLLIGQRLPDGQVRMYPSLALEALRVADGKIVYKVKSYGQRIAQGYGIQSVGVGDYTVPTDSAGRMRVYYAGHRHWRPLYIPAWKVLQHDPSVKNLVKGKIVLVGTSAIGLYDLRSSPLNAVLPGVEVHAEALEQILGRQFLIRPGYFNGLELCVTVAISLGIIFLAPFVGTGMLALIVTLLLGAGIDAALYAYAHYRLLFAPVYPSLSVVIIFIVSSILTNLRSETERRAIRDAFGHYVAPALLEELTRDPDKLKLG
ncbi:MAG: CHASE2 domain-containing protein, partial [Alphaproteobacteria bacterium]|nr:CHASE2 domain-containing protein [Alphaproteobacteria bacterium]